MVPRRLILAVFLVFPCLLGAEPAPSTPLFSASLPAEVRLKNMLQKVYETMDQNYYMPVNSQIYDTFVKTYTVERLQELNSRTKQTDDFIHLGAGLLVNKLKSPRDKLTVFIPPKKTKEFKDKAYAVTEDLGITGKLEEKGFKISKVQKHSDAALQGIKAGDFILKINGIKVQTLSQEAIDTKLRPELDSWTTLEILFSVGKLKKEIKLQSKSYFKETVEKLMSDRSDTLILKITHFNQKTADDFGEELTQSELSQIKNLIIDLRDNEGGPPLAAREILGFFTQPNDHLFAIARKRKPPVMMAAPPKPITYGGDITVLVNHKTGSASEMFSGVLQAKHRATLIGQKTAGATYLKSMYDFEDNSSIFMITSLTFYFDRRVFPDDGITPDQVIPETDDALKFALKISA